MNLHRLRHPHKRHCSKCKPKSFGYAVEYDSGSWSPPDNLAVRRQHYTFTEPPLGADTYKPEYAYYKPVTSTYNKWYNRGYKLGRLLGKFTLKG